MTTHHLRQLTDLLRFSVTSGESPLGKLTGLTFDPVDWAVRSVVAADPGTLGGPVLVPVRFFRSIDDARRELCFEDAGVTRPAAAADRAGGPPRAPWADAAGLLGRLLAGRDEVAGRVDDLIVNIDAWRLRYLVVRTRTGRVLTDVEWCSLAEGDDERLDLDLPAAAVAGAPPYRGLDALCIGCEEELYRHYTSRKYAVDSGFA